MSTRLFVRWPNGDTEAICVELDETPEVLRQRFEVEDFRVRFQGRDIQDGVSLEEVGVEYGDMVSLMPRLRGGANMHLKIETNFGCWCCCNKMFCAACGTGRVYEVEVRSIDNVSVIFDKIAEQNPKWTEKGTQGTLTFKNEILEPSKKILFYDMKDNSQLRLQITPKHYFFKDFRKTPKKEVDSEEEELRKEVAARKAAKKKQKEEEQAHADEDENAGDAKDPDDMTG